MADKERFPQIPGTVWWGVRAILNRTPNTTIDDRALAAQLNVQPAAAKQYITELVSVGILTDEFKATPLAHKWRLDATYKQAIDELNAAVYPASLRDTAPQAEGDCQKAVSWFQHAGLGEGAAKNKAGTYFLLGTENPADAPTRSASSKPNTSASATAKPQQKPTKAKSSENAGQTRVSERSANLREGDGIPLNVNVQIHISADAGTEQIEAIFSAMRRYLYDKQGA